jgi:Ricin-type beta-trefoil lectin domain/Lysozyme like domain
MSFLRRVAVATALLAGAILIHGTAGYAGTVRPSGASAAPIGALASCTQQSFLEGDHYSAVQVAQLAQQAGFAGNDWVISVAVAEAESAGWTHARLINTDCSVDRGLWQINSYWHGEVSDACAFDPTCNAQATHTIWSNGGWTQWTTYNNGAYQAHMAEAQAAVNQVGGGGGGGSRVISNWNGKCIDVPGANFADGSHLQMYGCNGTVAQNWNFTGGTLRTQNNMCMDVAWGSTANGAVIQIATCSGNPAQQFVLSGAGDLVNPQANKCVDIKDWNGNDGAALQLWDCAGTANQKWHQG